MKSIQIISMLATLLLFAINSIAQDIDSTKSRLADLHIPNTISTHPLGIYISRLPHNFQMAAQPNKSMSVNVSNGNVWLPKVKGYIPTYEKDREPLRELIWFQRGGVYDFSSPADSLEFMADGLYRSYRIKFELPINSRHEIDFELRAFSIERGHLPNALLTSDTFIEWFHSNVKGGEDPFARKHYGFDQLGVKYTDVHGRSFNLDKAALYLSGLEVNYSFFPEINKLNSKGFFTNISLHLGVNTNQINPGIDVGINSSSIKSFNFSSNEFFLGMSLSMLNQKVIPFGRGIEISNNRQLYSVEFLTAYRRTFKNSNTFTIGINCHIQSAYSKTEYADYYVLKGEPISSHWNYALSHLYRPLLSNSLTLSFTKGYLAYAVYLREDFIVDNAPDGQSGIEITYYLPD